MKNRAISFFLTLAMLLSLLPVLPVQPAASAAFSGKSADLESGTYIVRLADGSYLGSNGTAFASRVTVSSTPTELTIQAQSDGTYTIGVMDGSTVMNFDNWDNSTANGAGVRLASGWAAARCWNIYANGDGTCTIVSKTCGNTLARNGSNADTMTSPSAADSHWIIESTRALADGVYILRSAKDQNYCLTLGSNATMTAYSTAMTNRFAICHYGSNDYQIRNLGTGKYLTCAHGNEANNYNNYALIGDGDFSQMYWESVDRQLWEITKENDGSFVLKTNFGGGVMDVNKATPSEGQIVGQYARSSGAKSQQWILQRVSDTTTVTLNPALASPFHNGEFQGWGTALCWWANRIGYSETLTKLAADAFYSDNGLSLDIGRYNIGGGDDPTHNHITRSDSAIPGTWSSFRYTNGGSDVEVTYDVTKDRNQLNVAKALKTVNPNIYFEGFSNSPPYFMTNSGCTGGNSDANSTNIREDMYDDFAAYIARSTQLMKDEGIEFQSYSPINEPDGINTWWSWSSKQEGCRVTPGADRAKIITATRQALDNAGFNDVLVASFDDSNLDNSITEMTQLKSEYPQAAADLGRIDTHTYSGSKRRELRATAQEMGKDLWMSEVDDGIAVGNSSMKGALWLANRIITDVNHMQPAAWVMWNIIDEHRDSSFVNCNGQYSEKSKTIDPNGAFWGVALADHDKQTLELSQKYYGYGQFTRYIEPGDTIIASSDTTLAAYNKKSGDIKIVAVNCDTFSKDYIFDLSAFSNPGSTVTTYRTSGSYANGEHWAQVDGTTIQDTKVIATLAPSSITTFVIHGKGANGPRTVAPGQYRIRLSNGEYLSTAGTAYAARATVGSDSAIFDIGVRENGYYSISRLDGTTVRALDNWDKNVANGAKVCLSGRAQAPAQDWAISRNVDGTFTITSSSCMNVLAKDGSYANTLSLENATAANSHWRLEPVSDLKDGVYAIRSAKDESVCITIPEEPVLKNLASNGRGLRIAVSRCADGNYLLRSPSTGLYLTAANADSYYLTGSALLSGNDRLRQEWRLEPMSDGSYAFRNALSGKVLDIEKGNAAADQKLGQWALTDGAAHQHWKLTPLDSLIDGVYTISAPDGRVWDGSSNLTLKQPNGSKAQQFLLRHTDSGFYTASPLGTNLYVNLYPADPPGAGDVLFRAGLYYEDPLTHFNDQWYVLPNADGSYSFISCAKGLYLGISDDQVQAQTPHDQSWSLNLQAPVSDGLYTIQNADLALTPNTNGWQLTTAAPADSKNQLYRICAASNGSYTLQNVATGLLLNVSGGAAVNGTEAILYMQQNNINERWSLIPNADGTVSLVACANNLYLNLTDASSIQLRQADYSLDAAMKWQLKAHVHSFTAANAVPATCTESGYTGDNACFCGETTPGSAIPATGHTVVVDAAVEPTCTADGKTEGSHCSVCNTVLVEQKMIPMLGHKYENGICTRCDSEKPSITEARQKLKVYTVSISLRSDLAMNFYVRNTDLAGIENPSLVFTKAIYDENGNVIDYDTKTVTDFTIKSGCHVFTFRDLAAREMSSTITATVCGTVDGVAVTGEEFVYSIRDYAMKLLNFDNDIALKTLLVSMLNYGATAQNNFRYHTDALANAGLTDEDQALVAEQETDFTAKGWKSGSQDGKPVLIESVSVSLKDRVLLKPYLDLTEYLKNGKLSDVELVYTINGEDHIIPGTQLYPATDDDHPTTFYYNVSELSAAQMRTPVFFYVRTASDDHEQLSITMRYSIAVYASTVHRNKDNVFTPELVAMVEQMLKYGDSAKDFLIG